MKETIGLIGLGLLGSALAERLLQAGFAVCGYDIAADRRAALVQLGGTAAESPADVFARCARTLLSLPTTSVVEQVLAIAALRRGQVIVDTTTGEPDATAAWGTRLAVQGVSYLDATIAGSSALAREGNVVVMAGGERAAFDGCGDLFATFARQSFHVGPWGSGARMKLVVNLVLGLNRAVLAEGLTFAQACGLDLAETLSILQAGAAYSRAMDAKGEKMVTGDFTPQATLAQHLKDVRLILEAGTKAGAQLPLSSVHRDLLERAAAAGYAEADNSAVIKAFGFENLFPSAAAPVYGGASIP